MCDIISLSYCTTLWLNSHHAYIELPAVRIPIVDMSHRKLLRANHCPWEEVKFEFFIVHQEDTLDFSYDVEGHLKLQVVNGGFRRSDLVLSLPGLMKARIEHWKDVELDPDAEIISDLPPSDASHYAVCGDPSTCPSIE